MQYDNFQPQASWNSMIGFQDNMGWNIPTPNLTSPPLPVFDEAPKEIGLKAGIQRFYEGPRTCKCCINWVEKKPEAVPDDAKEKYDGVAVRIYLGKDHFQDTLGGLKATTPQTVVIQSPIIRERVKSVLAEAGMPGEGKEKITIHSPFRILFFTYSNMKRLHDECDPGSNDQAHFKVLLEVLDELFLESSQRIADLHDQNLIDCRYIWTLFPKGILIYNKSHGEDLVYELLDVDLERKKNLWLINCRRISFNGTSYGWSHITLSQPVFHGTRVITDLVAYPLKFHQNADALERKFLQRGESVLNYQDMSYKEYSGDARLCPDEGEDDFDDDKRRKSANVTGRVMVDHHSYYKYNPFWVPEIESLVAPNVGTDKSRETEDVTLRVSERPTIAKQNWNKEYVQKEKRWLMLLNPFLPGFSFKDNSWFWLSVSHLKPVQWNSEAYESVVFLASTKDLLLTLVQHHKQLKRVSTDVIEGKGQGLVVMMSGPPGTGKTLTVEASMKVGKHQMHSLMVPVADQAQKPVHYIQADMLGSSARAVSCNVRRAFDLCMEWDAILLFDEADAFLHKRGTSNSDKDDIVCVMLRAVEYYSGIVFFTTNTPDVLDPAFLSRFDMHLAFPPLSEETRNTLWSRKIESASLQNNVRVRLSESDVARLSSYNLNGREIKNIIKMAFKWSTLKQEERTIERLITSISVAVPQNEGDEHERSLKRKRVIEV